MLCGVVRFDPGILAAAVAALLGGIVIWGSNRSTAMEAVKDLAVAEADRSAMMPSLTKGDKSTLQRRGAAKQSKGRLNLSASRREADCLAQVRVGRLTTRYKVAHLRLTPIMLSGCD